MRLVQSNLVNAVQSASHDGGGGPVQIAQAKAKQGARIFRDIGMEAINAKLYVARSIVPAAKNGLNVRVTSHRADVARSGIRDVKLVGAEPI